MSPRFTNRAELLSPQNLMDDREILELTIEAKLLTHCAPVFFLPHPGAMPGLIHANGTLGLISTSSRKLLVTCCHVWDEFVAFRDRNPSAQLATVFAKGFGPSIPIDDSMLIDRDASLDIAIFGAPTDGDYGLKEFFRLISIPQPTCSSGDIVHFLGFTGGGRHTIGYYGNFEYSMFGLSVSASSDRKFVMASHTSRRHLTDNAGRPMSPIDLGGLSGSPVFRLFPSGAQDLAGFIQMGRTSDADIYATHASCIRSDGSLAR